MDTVPIQYLKQHLAEVLADVSQGNRVVITRRNRPIATIAAIVPEGRRRGIRFGDADLKPLPFGMPSDVLHNVLADDRADDR